MHFEVKIDQDGFKGSAVLDFPTRQEKIEILKLVSSTQAGEDTGKLLDLANIMGEMVEKRLVSIDVKHEESGIEIKDKTMLDIYTECSDLTGIISNFIIGGVSLLGKPKS